MTQRYWRRSSRWRRSFRKTDPRNVNYWRLVALGHNHSPFSGYATRMLEYVLAMEGFDKMGDDHGRDLWLIQDFCDLL